VALISVACGLFIGLLAGFFRILDAIIMRIMDGLMAIRPSCWRSPWCRCSAPAC